MPKPPAPASRKQAKVEQRARTTAPRPAKPTRAACRAADAIRARGGVVGAEFGLLAVAARPAQLPAFRARVLEICDDERSRLSEAERGHDVVVAAARQMEKALGRLAAAADTPRRGRPPRAARPPAARP
jgi:hypothetical protein